MIGAIIGDIVGSRFEFNNHRSKDFELFTEDCFFTDDTVMKCAVADALIMDHDPAQTLRDFGIMYPGRGYGSMFQSWIKNQIGPYNSYGNGAAMRVSPVAYWTDSFYECIDLSRKVTEVTHNHPEGIKGAEAVATSIWLARFGADKDWIRTNFEKYYTIDFTLDEIRDSYKFDETCQGSVPQAFEAFYESVNFEDAIRNAISIGGDSDTIAAITGSIAEAFYGVPEWMVRDAMAYLDDMLNMTYRVFQQCLRKKEEA